MTKLKRTKGQTTIYKALHRQIKTEQQLFIEVSYLTYNTF